MVAKRDKIWDINPKPRVPYEARVIIWEVNGINDDDKYDIVDIFVTCNF